VKTLKGHFDGRHIVLDEPSTLPPKKSVTVLAAESTSIETAQPTPDDTEDQFGALSKQWREEVGAESSLSKITGNMNYLRIISLGKKAVPLILRDLQREPAPWFLALRAITGEQNVGREYAGNFKQMADSWISWGREKGYI
jgi:hypothetical protein